MRNLASHGPLIKFGKTVDMTWFDSFVASLARLAKRVQRRPVLVVDDDDDLRALLRTALENQGFGPVIEAWDGESAIDKVRRHRPRFIVTDNIVRDDQSTRIAAFIRRLVPDTRIIVFSGKPTYPAWADACIPKPDLPGVIRTLEEFTAG